MSAGLQCYISYHETQMQSSVSLKLQTDYVYIIIRNILKSIKQKTAMFGQHIHNTCFAINLFNVRLYLEISLIDLCP